MRDQVHLRFQADEAQVRPVLKRVLAECGDAISASSAAVLELVLAEVLNNIVEHAYAGQVPGPVCLSLHFEGATMTCKVTDSGLPMPGLCLPAGLAQVIPDDIRDLHEGGWGWALIRALTDDLRYARCGNVNHLTLWIPMNRPTPAGD